MSFNWKNELDKLHRAYEWAVSDNDTYAQERIAREIAQVEEFIQLAEMRERA